MVTLQRLLNFSVLCVSLWALPPPAPLDSSNILIHRSHNTYLNDLEDFIFEREQKYLQNETKLSTVGNKLLE